MRAQLERQLAIARRRCSVNLLLSQSATVGLAAGGLAVMAVLIDRLLAVPVLSATSVWVLAVAAVAATAGLWAVRRPNPMATAVLIDQRMGTQERFSTAWALARQDEPFARAACQEAHRAVEHIDVRKGFPVRPPRRWLATLATWGLFAGLVVLLPAMDLLAGEDDRRQARLQQEQKQLARRQVEQTAKVVRSAVERIDAPELTQELDQLAKTTDLDKPRAIRRQAIRKLGDLSEKVDRLRRQRGGGVNDAVRRMLKQLRGTRDGLSRELNRALSKSEFGRAARMLDKLRKDLAEGKLSAEQADKLRKQLSDLSGQLQEIADQKRALEDQLRREGLDPKLASQNEQDMRQALQDKGWSDEQIQELMDKLQDMKCAASRLGELGEAMAQAGGEGMSPSELADVMEQLGDMELAQQQLEDMEGLLAELDAARTRLGQCQGGLADTGRDGPWQEGVGDDRPGVGSGGPGLGEGFRQEQADENYTLDKERVKNRGGKGPVIASWAFRGGPQEKGQARKEVTEAVRTARDEAAEAIETQRIPRKYETSLKRYFGDVEKTVAEPNAAP